MRWVRVGRDYLTCINFRAKNFLAPLILKFSRRYNFTNTIIKKTFFQTIALVFNDILSKNSLHFSYIGDNSLLDLEPKDQ